MSEKVLGYFFLIKDSLMNEFEIIKIRLLVNKQPNQEKVNKEVHCDLH